MKYDILQPKTETTVVKPVYLIDDTCGDPRYFVQGFPNEYGTYVFKTSPSSRSENKMERLKGMSWYREVDEAYIKRMVKKWSEPMVPQVGFAVKTDRGNYFLLPAGSDKGTYVQLNNCQRVEESNFTRKDLVEFTQSERMGWSVCDYTLACEACGPAIVQYVTKRW